METTFSPEDWLAPTEVLLNDVPCDLDMDLPILDMSTAFDAPTLCARPETPDHRQHCPCLGPGAGLVGLACGGRLQAHELLCCARSGEAARGGVVACCPGTACSVAVRASCCRHPIVQH